MIFDIQRFSDTITSSSDLKIGMQFADADTRILTIPDPDPTVTGTDIANAFTDIITDNLLIGDRTGASITGLYTAYTDETTRTKLDLS